MRKLTAELKTISVCARSIISKSQGGHFLSSLSSNSSSSVLDEFSITSYMVGMSFHTWQKINIQTMAKDIRVNLFSVACMLCCCGLDWTRTSILFRLKGSSGKIGESWRLEHRAWHIVWKSPKNCLIFKESISVLNFEFEFSHQKWKSILKFFHTVH